MANRDCTTAGQFTTALANVAAGTWPAGDVIRLDAGVVFEGNWTLPVIPGYTAGIGSVGGIKITTLETVGLPPANTRTGSSYSAVMPKLRGTQASNYTNLPVLKLAPGAQGWYLENLEIRQSYTGGGAMVAFGQNDATVQSLKSHIPSDCHISQCYFDGLSRIVGQRRGIDLHATDSSVKHCHIRGGSPDTDSNDSIGIWLCNGEGGNVIENNWVEGWTENILSCGDNSWVSTSATVNSSPTPSTTSCDLTITNGGDPPVVGQIVAVPTTSSTLRLHPTVLTVSDQGSSVYRITYAELTAAPTPGGQARWGVNPDDVTIVNNRLSKPLAWRDNAMIATPGNISVAASGSGTSLTAGTYQVQVGARAVGFQGADTPSRPSAKFSVNLTAGQQIDVSWDAVTNGERYRVYVTHPDGTIRYKEVTSPTVSTSYSTNGTTATSLASGANWRVKNLLEMKGGANWTIEENIFEQCWPGVESGNAIWLKSVNQPTGNRDPFRWTHNVTFRYNIVRHVSGFFSLSGCEFSGSNQNNRPKLMSDVTIEHNLMYDSSSAWSQGNEIWAFRLSNGCTNLTINRNTAISANQTGLMYLISSSSKDAYLRGLSVTNNLFRHGTYGVKGGSLNVTNVGSVALDAHSQSNYTFTKNAIAAIELSGSGSGNPYSSSLYPSGNLFPTQTVFAQASEGGYFTDYAGFDFSLRASSPALGAGVGGVDLGCDVAEVLSRTARVLSGIPEPGAPEEEDPIITTTTLPNGTVGIAYDATIQATSGVTPYAFTVTSGSLAGTGLALTTNSAGTVGRVSGTPLAAGDISITVTCTDDNANTGTKAYTFTIAAAPADPLIVTPGSLPDGTVGAAYSATLSIHGGIPPYAVVLDIDQTLPDGLALVDSEDDPDAQDNVIAGTPTTAGTTSVTFVVSDVTGTSITHTLSITIADQSFTVHADALHRRALQWEYTRLGSPAATLQDWVESVAYERITPIKLRYDRAKARAIARNYSEAEDILLRDDIDSQLGVDDSVE